MQQHPDNAQVALPLIDNGASPMPPAATKPVSARFVMRRGWVLLLPLFLFIFFSGAVVGMYFQPPGLRAFFHATGLVPGAGTDTPIAVAIRKVTAQEEIAVISEGDVVALGRIIPRGDVTSVATPSGAGDARIAAINVTVGAQVVAGDVLAVLDNLPQLQHAAASARAAVAVREAALAQTRATIHASKQEAQAGLERAEATAAAAKADLDRATSLFERGLATRADLDQIAARAIEAGRDVERNRATLSRFATTTEATQTDIAVAEANLAAARVDLARSEQDMERAYVRAPIAGQVLDINARAGERPGVAGIINLGDTRQMTVQAEVYQTMIGRVAIGDPVTITADALRGELTGTVSAIGLEIGRQSITSAEPAANTDARVVDVIIMLDARSSALAQNFTNLETVVRIDAGRAE
ncbi:HlyD family efflux transporter periplasmic adaptor subunit [Pseudorhodobacter sp.]|uniref:HlyD family efflux transporter periplasmic adaptor subunit n=1 Tax=Pseudorhodobacter sp. TaxID=1934400 RepID=UPI002649947B|nr:HlyD family efflux transporter periplasmic adaptor subunit [Pseudorhodobacter sp.]MDN5786654.1 HlyD family efflux transporter periplasmic adaptor subunit [Pseudorhodobacter sp.]